MPRTKLNVSRVMMGMSWHVYKGDRERRIKLDGKRRKCANTSIGSFLVVVPSIFMQQELFFASNLRVQPFWFALYQWTAEKTSAHDVTDTCTTHAGLDHDVSERLPVKNWQWSRPCFRDFQVSTLNKLGHKPIKKQKETNLLWVFFFFLILF